MTLNVEAAWILTVLLVSIRFGMVFTLTPLFGAAQIPVRVRVLFVLGMSAFLVMGLKSLPMAEIGTINEILKAGISEVVLGGLLAFGVLTAFGAFLLAGRIIDVQMGFNVAGLIDPATRGRASVMGTLLSMLAVMVFFTIDGHHLIIRGLAFSLEHQPPGAAWTGINPGLVVAQFGAMFTYGVAIVAPALFGVLLVDVGMAVMARTMPQMNVFIVSLPLKIFVGLSLTAISLNYLAPLLNRLFESIFIYWQSLFSA